MKRRDPFDDDDDDDDGRDKWIIAKWCIRSDIALLCVPDVDGRPRADLARGLWNGRPYEWRSYHAAAAWKRRQLNGMKGYIICNFSEMIRLEQISDKTSDLLHEQRRAYLDAGGN